MPLATVLCLALAGAPSLPLEVRVGDGPWQRTSAVAPLKGQRVSVRIAQPQATAVRWFRISARLEPKYQNADFPWDPHPYRWRGLAKIDYVREALPAFANAREVLLFTPAPVLPPRPEATAKADVGTFWLQAEAETPKGTLRSAGLEDVTPEGLPAAVLRISVREREGYLGWITSFFNVPGVFGSTTSQSQGYLGVDCADVLMAARAQMLSKPLDHNVNVAELVKGWRHLRELELSDRAPLPPLRWGVDFQPGDLLAVRYPGAAVYGHIGALEADANGNGLLDLGDTVLHAGPAPLRRSLLSEGGFFGSAVILRAP